MTVDFVLNGERMQIDRVDPHVTLLQWLRASGRTGTKEGCAEGECGACAVAILGADTLGRRRFEPVNACLLPLPAVEGRTVVTVEGIASEAGDLHPVQQAMVEAGGSQCGYCTPGFVVSLFCEYYRADRGGYDPEAIAGNLCRCTGYRPQRDVARALPRPADGDPWLEVLARGTPPPEDGRYLGGHRLFLRPTSAASLFAALTEFPDARLLSGGTDLMVEANQRGARWPVLVALESVGELRVLDRREDEIVLGAGVPLSAIEAWLACDPSREFGLLGELFPLFSSRLIRNRATLGGNLATASPIGDAAPALLALDASLRLSSAQGERRIALADFFTAYRRTALGPGEIIGSVHIPLPGPRWQRFYKVSKRPLDDISTVAAAFALDLDDRGRVERLRVAYGGVAATPMRAIAAERFAVGRPWNEATLSDAIAALGGIAAPITDHRGSAAYRTAMMRKLLERFFLETAAAREATR